MGVLDQNRNELVEIEDTIFGRVGEMGTFEVGSDLPVPSVLLDKIKAKDDDPMFVTAEVESGWSKSKRNWKPEHLRKVVDMVNNQTMGGVLGHPLLKDPKAYESDFPEPQVLWVKAGSREVGGKLVARFKGYVLKSAKAREYLHLGLIDGVSIFGPTKMKPVQGGYDVVDFSPESIDFARKGRSGMTSRVVALAGEQMTGGNSMDAKDIAAISEDEIRTHAPLLVKEIERKALEPVETKIGEQATLVAELQPEADLFSKVKELLKIADGENVLDKVENLLKTVEDASMAGIKSYLGALISKKVKTPRVQAIVNREIVGEMTKDYAGQELTDELRKKIEVDFVDRIENDDELKVIVGEMAPFEDGGKGGNGMNRGGASLGGRSAAGEKRGRGDEQASRGSLTITKQRIGA
jgi:hypothetical protein